MSEFNFRPNVDPVETEWASSTEMRTLTTAVDEVHMAALTGQTLSRVSVGFVDAGNLELKHDGSQTSVRFTQGEGGVWTMVRRVQGTEDSQSMAVVEETTQELVAGASGLIDRQQYIRAAAGYKLIDTVDSPAPSFVDPFTGTQCRDMTEELRSLLSGERWGWLLRPVRALARGLNR